MCQDRNSKLTQRIIELDNWIEEERQKWKEQLEAEKKSLKVSCIGYTRVREAGSIGSYLVTDAHPLPDPRR
mgnify:FL=1